MRQADYQHRDKVAADQKCQKLAIQSDLALTIAAVAWQRFGNADAIERSGRTADAGGSAQAGSKTAAGGRYVKSTERHERILLNICEAMGITSYAGFGDPGLTGTAKTPLPNIAA